MNKSLIVALAIVFATLSLPCRAQQASVEHLKATAVALTAESSKRGENAAFQVCGADNTYSLCITFPGADATDFAQRIYGNSDFAKKAAHEGFTAALIRNTTTDKELSQNYAMNVTEEGWAANDKYIHDPAEEIAALLATNQHDPATSVIAFRAFLQRYPNSVAKESVLNRLMVAERQAGDNDGSIATARQLLAIVDASDPVRVGALWEVVHLSIVEAAAGTNAVQNATQAKEYSEKGMQALDQIKRPESMSEEQFATSQSNFRVFFQGVIGADKTRSATVNTKTDAEHSPCAQDQTPVLKKEARASGPFGFQAGMTREQITKLVGTAHVGTAALLGIDHLDDDVMVVNRAPVSNPAIETYWLVISPTEGLLHINAVGIDIKTDSYGTQLRTAYRNAVATDTRKYGKPDDGDPMMTDGCIQNPKNEIERMSSCVYPDGYLVSLNNAAFGRFWSSLGSKDSPPDGVVGIHVMAHLRETKPFDPRIAASVYRATGLTIESGKGYVSEEYDFAGFDAYLNAQKAAAELNREAAEPVIRNWEPWRSASQIIQIVEEEKRQRQSYAEDLTKSMAGEIRWGAAGRESEIGIVPLSETRS